MRESFSDPQYAAARARRSKEETKNLVRRCKKLGISCQEFLKSVGDRAWKIHTIHGSNYLAKEVVSYVETPDNDDTGNFIILLRTGETVIRQNLIVHYFRR